MNNIGEGAMLHLYSFLYDYEGKSKFILYGQFKEIKAMYAEAQIELDPSFSIQCKRIVVC